MIYLNRFNETVWSGRIDPDDDIRFINSVTGYRKTMCVPISDLLDDVGLGGLGSSSLRWEEPRKSYAMPYDMSRSRLCLSVDYVYSERDFSLSNSQEDLFELKSQLIGLNIGILSIRLYFRGSDSVEILNEELDSIYDMVKDIQIRSIRFTFKLFTDIGEYNDEYIKSYLDFLG